MQLEKYITKAEKEQQFTLPLDAAAVTGSRLNIAIRDMPVSVSVIVQEQIQVRGFRTATEAVEGAVGMSGSVAFGSIPNYSTRGFTGNNVSLMRDGIRQNTASQSSRSVETFTLDRVEILKGPSSILFGEGAIGGAVNYVSKSPQKTFSGEMFASYSSLDNMRLGIGYGGPIIKDKLLFRADVSYVNNEAYVHGVDSKVLATAGSLQWLATPKLSTSIHLDYLKDSGHQSYYGLPVIYDSVVNITVPGSQPQVRLFTAATDSFVKPRIDPRTRRFYYNIPDNFVKTENAFFRWKTDFVASPEINFRNTAYVAAQNLGWRNMESVRYIPTNGLVEIGSFNLIHRNDVLVGDRADVTWDTRLAGHRNRFLGGFDFSRNDQVRGERLAPIINVLGQFPLVNPTIPAGPPNTTWTNTANYFVYTRAFFIEDLFEASDRLKIMTGLRFENIAVKRKAYATGTTFTKKYEPSTGRIGAVWTAKPNLNLYASYSNAAEPVVQLIFLQDAQKEFALQKGVQYEVGMKQTFWQGRADATLALFHIKKKDILTTTLVDNVRIPQQVGAQVGKGVEAALSLALDSGWRIEANFAYTDAQYEDFNENLGTGIISRNGKTPPNVAKILTNLHLARKWKNGFSISGGPRYVSKRAANNNNGYFLPSYVTVDGAVNYAWHNYLFSLRGRNLTDKEYQESAYGGGAQWRLSDPRSVELTMRYYFRPDPNRTR